MLSDFWGQKVKISKTGILYLEDLQMEHLLTKFQVIWTIGSLLSQWLTSIKNASKIIKNAEILQKVSLLTPPLNGMIYTFPNHAVFVRFFILLSRIPVQNFSRFYNAGH